MSRNVMMVFKTAQYFWIFIVKESPGDKNWLSVFLIK